MVTRVQVVPRFLCKAAWRCAHPLCSKPWLCHGSYQLARAAAEEHDFIVHGRNRA